MKMRARIQRLEKLADVRGGQGDFESMTDPELLAQVQAMFRDDPFRRWEELLPEMGYSVSEMLVDARAAKQASIDRAPGKA